MPGRKARGPRLLLRRRAGREAVWVILGCGPEISTGCNAADVEGAERKLAEAITARYEPPKTGGKLASTYVVDVIGVYLKGHAPKTADKGKWIGFILDPVAEWWAEKTLAQIHNETCDRYKDHRLKQGVSDQTVRHELGMLSTAIRYYHGTKHGPLDALPKVTLPPKAGQRDDYWLTRKMAADRIRAARRLKRCKHVIRCILIGVYSGTRGGASKTLRWVPSPHGGWIDLDNEIMYRKPSGRAETKKRQPKCRIHARLLPHLRRWRKADMAEGITHVIHYYGQPVKKLRRSWVSVAIEAGHATPSEDGQHWIVSDGPHILRHTAATWQMLSGTDPYVAAGYLGMSVDTLLDTYGHHHPDFQSGAASATGRRRTK